MNPQSQLYTRAQIATLTGIDTSTLNYWNREDLLIPAEGGTGKGSHRRFDWVQVNIAAILGELRAFRLNISSLRSLAALLQSAAQLGAKRELHPSNYVTAARLATQLSLFRAGTPVPIKLRGPYDKPPAGLRGNAYGDWLAASRPAESEDEVVNKVLCNCEHDSHEAILAIAERLGPGKEDLANLYGDLVYDILAPGYAGSYSWLLALNPDESWRVAFGQDGSFFGGINDQNPEDFGTAIFIPVSGAFQRVWGLKSPAYYRRQREAGRIQLCLARAGIEAEVRLGETEDDDFDIHAPGVDPAAIAAALGTGFEQVEAAGAAS